MFDLGKTYYKVLPSKWTRYGYCVKVWRWWLPFWITAIDFISEERAAKWIQGHSIYYDG